MKLFSIASLLFLFSLHTSKAQSELKIKEETHPMSLGNKIAFIVEVPQYSTTDFQKEWVKYIRKKTKASVKASNSEWKLLNAKLDGILVDSLSIYAHFSQGTNGASITAFFAQNDNFFSSANNPAIANSIKGLMYDFAKTAYIHIVEKELDNANRKLNSMKDEKERLQKSEDKNLKEIEESNHTIEHSETELDAVKEELEIKQKDIFTQKQKALTLSKKSEERQEQNEIVRGMEKDRNQHLRRQKNLAATIATQNTNVRAKERYIVTLKSQQDKKTGEIKKQEEVVATIESKLEAVKKLAQDSEKK
jgi:hypothetical protein